MPQNRKTASLNVIPLPEVVEVFSKKKLRSDKNAALDMMMTKKIIIHEPTEGSQMLYFNLKPNPLFKFRN